MTQERLDIPVGIDLSQVKAALAQAKKDAQFFSNNLKAAATQATKVELEQTKVANTLNAIAKMSDDGIKRIFIAGAEGIKAIDLEALKVEAIATLEALKVEAIATIEAMNAAWDSQGQRIANIMDGINQLNEQSIPPLPPPPPPALPAPAPAAAVSAAGPTAVATASTMAAVASRGLAVAMGAAAVASVAVGRAASNVRATIDEARTSFDLFRAAQNAPAVDPNANFQKKDLEARATLEAERIEKARASRDAEISGYKDTAAAAAKSADIVANANARAAASATKHEWENRKTAGSVGLLRTAFAPVGGLVKDVAGEYGGLNPKLAETADKSRKVAAESRDAAAAAAKKQYVLTGAMNESSTTTEQYGHVIRAAGLSQRFMVREIEGGQRIIGRMMSVASAATTPLRAMRAASERNRNEWRLLRGLLGQPEPQGPGLIAKSFAATAKASAAMAGAVAGATRKTISRVAAMDVVQKEIKFQKAQWEELKKIFREDIAGPLAAKFAPAVAKIKEFSAAAMAAGSQAVASLKSHLHNLAQTPFAQRVFGVGATAAKHFATAANAIAPRLKAVGSAAVASAVKFAKWTQSQNFGKSVQSAVAKSMLFLHQRTRLLHPVFGLVTGTFGKLLGRFRTAKPATQAVAQSTQQVRAAAAAATPQLQNMSQATQQVNQSLQQTAPAANQASGAIRNVAGAGANAASGGLFGMMKGALATKLAFGALAIAAMTWGATTAIATETATVKFGTLLRDMGQGKALIKEITAFSARTPFSNEELRKSAGLLLAAQIPANQITKRLQVLGDIASGVSKPIGEITTVFQKVASTGKLSLDSLNQLAERGVPIYGQLADQLGVSRSEMLKMVSEGKLGFSDLDKALTALATGTGVFAGGMERQSNTFAGLWSTLKDNIAIALEAIMGGFVEASKPVMSVIIEMAQTATGYIQRMQPVFQSVIGAATALFTGLWSVGVYAFQVISDAAVSMFGITKNDGGSTFDALVKGLTGFFAAAQFAFQNLPLLARFAWTSAELAFLKVKLSLKHFFYSTMPTMLGYLHNKWNNFWKDAQANVGVVFSNIKSNIKSVMDGIWAYIASAGFSSMTSSWTPILSGFQKTITEIPELPSRVVNQYEVELSSQIDEMTTTIQQGAAQAIAEAMERAKPEELPELSGDKGLDTRVAIDKNDGNTNQQGPDSFTVDSLERGSAEALKAIFSSQQRDKTPKDQLAEQKKTNSLLSQIAAAGGNTPQLAGAIP